MGNLIRYFRNKFYVLRESRLWAALKNKYVLTAIIFFIWILIFDQNNLGERRKINHEYKELLEEKEYYLNKIEEDRNRIEELKTDNENLEKFAREQYLMKKENEDIFIIVDE
ncbi:MAG: septum formation initiator family protein [Bacteroidales bacterium]|nr:septum formation initiator family protein [Bacteroidales bacterium]